ncbi:MAG TPA: hypothetical protein VL943_04310 [Niabella sp.]|nr:hypothetical protein [Niabella sp.]
MANNELKMLQPHNDMLVITDEKEKVFIEQRGQIISIDKEVVKSLSNYLKLIDERNANEAK